MSTLINKGPKFTTSNVKTINGEDHLGIRAVGISIADQLQSGITSITPRARYWSFFAWVLHDFIQHAPEEKTMKNFKVFLKKQEWFFILANIAEATTRGKKTHGVIGITKGIEAWNKSQRFFEPYSTYVKDSFGGYATYRNVMKIAGITMIGDEEHGIHIDRLTQQTGKTLAKAFEQSIQHTDYYRHYRLTNQPVPREVLLEYGKHAGLNQMNQDHSMDYPHIVNIFMSANPKSSKEKIRKLSMIYYMNIINQSMGRKLSFTDFQDIMFDEFFHRQITVPKELQTVAIGWEIYQARQIFTFSLDTIWSYLLDQMSKKTVTMTELITTALIDLENSGYDLSEPIKELNRFLPLPQTFRKTAMEEMKTEKKSVKYHIWQPILVTLDVYNRLLNRGDFETLHHELLNLGGRNSISFTTWMEFVQSYQDKSIQDFISYILRYFILEQHQKVALNKMITTKNETYHFIENDGRLHFISDDTPAFNTFRVNQGLSILEDLGFIEESKGALQVTSLGKVKLNESN